VLISDRLINFILSAKIIYAILVQGISFMEGINTQTETMEIGNVREIPCARVSFVAGCSTCSLWGR
jgi:hypothetical protein